MAELRSQGGNPLAWLWLVIAAGLVVLGATTPVTPLLITCVATVLAVWLRGSRTALVRVMLGAALTVLLLWAALSLLLRTGVEALSDGLRATALIALTGLGSLCVRGRSWALLADATLGKLAPLVRPVCHVPDALVLADVEAAGARTWGVSPGLPTQLLSTASELAARDSGDSGQPAHNIRALLAVTAPAALLVLIPTASLPGWMLVLTGAELAALLLAGLVSVGLLLRGSHPELRVLQRHDLPVVCTAAALTVLVVIQAVLHA